MTINGTVVLRGGTESGDNSVMVRVIPTVGGLTAFTGISTVTILVVIVTGKF